MFLKKEIALIDVAKSLADVIRSIDDLKKNFATKNDLRNLEDRLVNKMEKMMDAKINNLAIMVAKGFGKTATKQDIENIRREMNSKIIKSEDLLKSKIINAQVI